MQFLFQGDSLTDAGRNRETEAVNYELGSGYVTLLAAELTLRDPQLNILNRGVSGDRIADIYARWLEDCLNLPYDLLSLLAGINDVGFSLRLNRGSNARRFGEICDTMLYEAMSYNPEAQLVLCQPFVLPREVPGGEWDNDIVRDWDLWSDQVRQRGDQIKKLAKKYRAIYVPMWDALNKALRRIPVERLTPDGIHLTAAGSQIIARCWLEAVNPYLEKKYGVPSGL